MVDCFRYWSDGLFLYKWVVLGQNKLQYGALKTQRNSQTHGFSKSGCTKWVLKKKLNIQYNNNVIFHISIPVQGLNNNSSLRGLKLIKKMKTGLSAPHISAVVWLCTVLSWVRCYHVFLWFMLLKYAVHGAQWQALIYTFTDSHIVCWLIRITSFQVTHLP